jgi:phospholipase/carboxylesterase
MSEAIEIVRGGAPLRTARAAAVLVHGRGASAQDILSLGAEFAQDDIAYLAPQAPAYTWYPYSFLVPFSQNEPHLTNALNTVDAVVRQLGRDGFAPERIALIGFSQGGCLALEYAARNAKRYGAVAGLSAGLIGPPGMPRAYPGAFDGTPVLLGCSDIDSHIPLARVHETRDVLGEMGAAVTERIYPRMGHTVNADEIAHVSAMLKGMAASR